MGEEEYNCPKCGTEILEFSNINAMLDMLSMRVETQKEAIDMLTTQVEIVRNKLRMWEIVGR